MDATQINLHHFLIRNKMISDCFHLTRHKKFRFSLQTEENKRKTLVPAQKQC